MKLTNEFTVAAPIDRTWETLLDLERVALCLPGAKVSPSDEDGTFRGRMKVKFGAVTTEYSGVATIRELDEDDHVAVFDVEGKEERGQGTASASITNRLEADGDSTKVVVETDLNITGRPAQFGRGLMEDVATMMLEEFARRLESEILGNGTGPSAAPAAGDVADGGTPAHGAGEDMADTGAAGGGDVLDVGAVAWQPIAKRAAPVALAVLLLSLLAVALKGRSRRGITLRVDL